MKNTHLMHNYEQIKKKFNLAQLILNQKISTQFFPNNYESRQGNCFSNKIAVKDSNFKNSIYL